MLALSFSGRLFESYFSFLKTSHLLIALLRSISLLCALNYFSLSILVCFSSSEVSGIVYAVSTFALAILLFYVSIVSHVDFLTFLVSRNAFFSKNTFMYFLSSSDILSVRSKSFNRFLTAIFYLDVVQG